MLILSPRAVERLESYTPPRPLPKLFRITKNGKLDREIFEGVTINTPSMLCVEDYLDALDWASRIGGLRGLMERADANAKVLYDWTERTPWIANLAIDPATRSNTSVCLKIVAPEILSLSPEAQAEFINALTALLDEKGVAHDIGSYRDAPPGLRIWTGATVEIRSPSPRPLARFRICGGKVVSGAPMICPIACASRRQLRRCSWIYIIQPTSLALSFASLQAFARNSDTVMAMRRSSVSGMALASNGVSFRAGSRLPNILTPGALR
jgi:hypothetical protein